MCSFQYLYFCSGVWWRCCGSAVWQSAWCLCTHCSGHWLCPVLWCEHCSTPHSGRHWGWMPLQQTPDTPVLQSEPGTHFRVMFKFAIKGLVVHLIFLRSLIRTLTPQQCKHGHVGHFSYQLILCTKKHLKVFCLLCRCELMNVLWGIKPYNIMVCAHKLLV